MIYTEDIAFIHIPKTSGMSIKKSIEINCPDAAYMPTRQTKMFNGDYHNRSFNDDWRRVMHYPYSYWEPMIEDKWVFSIVRNPYVRAVSFYVFMTTSYMIDLTFENMFSERYWTEHYKNPIRIYQNGLRLQTMTQTETLTGSNGLVPNIFKYEDGYAELEEKLGFKIDQKENVTTKYNYLDYYDEKRQKHILNLFEKDFENFSYDIELK